MNHTKRCFSFVGALALAAWSTPTSATTVHVAPDGNDAWSGVLPRPNAKKTDGPVASLIGARDKVRALKLKQKRGAANKDRVLVANGTYSVRAPLVLLPQDSGTAYEAAPNAKPVFSGGRVLSGWKAGADGVWSTPIPEVQAGKWYFEQLWVDGKRATRARTPNAGYLYVAEKAQAENVLVPIDVATINERAFRAQPQDVAPLLPLSGRELNDVTALVYHAWESARLRVAAVEPKSSTIVATGPMQWGFFVYATDQRYQLENFRAALDEPGEWFLSRSGTLFYKPLPGEDMTKARVLAPVAESFIEIKGEPENARLVENISFKGLSFRHAQYVLPEAGHSAIQAEFDIPAVVMADGARNVAFENCEIAHIGTYAIWFRRGCRDSKVVRCHLRDMGAGGVRIGEGGARVGEMDKIPAAQQTSHITVDNNIIHVGGRIHHGAIGVLIGQSGDNRVTHNDIGDFFYTGISVGWRWGYIESLSKRNKIEFNHIHHIGQSVLSDMAAVYTLGPSEGTTVSNNRVHDIHSHGYGGWGLYNDEGSTGIVLENNLAYNTKTGGYHQHYGRENIVRNNIFAFAKQSQLQRTRVEEHLSFTFERNLVFWNEGRLVEGNWNDKIATRNNLYWNADGDVFENMMLAERQAAGQDIGSIIADPNFVDAAARDFRLKPDSPAFKIGFVPFDASRAGVYGDAAWKNLASRAAMPKSQFASAPLKVAPLSLNDNFEATLVGGAPSGAAVHVENKGDGIAITEEVAGGGGRSLKIIDAPGLTYAHNPHFFFQPHHRAGTSRCRFDLRVEASTQMYHEWRNNAPQYKVGPSFWVRNGALSANGQTLMAIPLNAFVGFDVSAKVGAGADGTWSLKVALPNGETRVFEGLKTVSADWKRLDWLGFVSMAEISTTYYLDNLQLENTK